MTDTVATTTTAAAEPDGAPRIANLDILRGIAILGILFMNIPEMGASVMTNRWPASLGWTMADQIAWFARQILADGTARCMLEFLFGAGMVILTGRAAMGARWWTVLRRYYVRNIVLTLFGLAHIFLFTWFGDILHIYGLAALVVFPFRKLPPQWLIAIGLVYTVSLTAMGATGIYQVTMENAQVAMAKEHRAAGQPISKTERKAVRSNRDWHRQLRRNQRRVDRENANRTTTARRWIFQLRNNWTTNLGRGWLIYGLGEACATMLIGAALFKLGILQGARSAGFYARLMILGYLVGFTVRAVGAWQTSDFTGDGISIDWSLREIGRLSTTLGHVGLVSLLLTRGWGRTLLGPFKAAGRTALSVYVCQSVICLGLLFPPFALGLYGTMGFAGLMATALAVNAVLLVVANLWVKRFRIAPVEWAWRSLVEWRALPFRRAALA